MLLQLSTWLKENKERLLTLIGVILVGILSFEAGVIRSEIRQEKPLVLSIPALPSEISEKEESKTVVPPGSSGTERAVAVVGEKKDCVFVGSKNSNKYHLSTCAVAKRIKPENKVCFSSKEDAEKRGYIPSCLK